MTDLEADALAHLTEYFVRNYPGPNTIIGDPKWHAPKIFRAAQYAMRAELEALRKDTDDARRYRWLRDTGQDQLNVLAHYAGDAMDAAIDAAMHKPGEKP